MTLPTSTRVTDPYETDGVQRDFEFDFPAFYNADTGHYGIEVRRLTALDYEVIDKSLYDIFLNDEDKSGYVRFHVAPMAGDDIYIAGDTTRSQQLNLINYGRYSAQSIEKAFDLIVALIQEFVSKVDEETRQRILADQALRDFLLIKFNQFTAEVTTKIDKHIGDINGFISSLIPMFVCIMRKEITNYAETGMQDVIDEKLSGLSTQVADALAVLDESVSRINAATTATAIGARLFDTPAAGVNPVTGVPAGSYFNVRSPNAESYVDEYQNVGGVPTPTGKRYLSALGVQQQEKPASTIKDANGKTQQEINNVINSKYVSVDNYPDIIAALNAIQGTNAILLLNDSAEYTIDNASTQFFSRIETNGKRAKIIVTERTKLSTFGKDLYLKNIVIVQAGKRVGIADNTFSAKSLFDYSMPAIDNLIIEDVDCYAVTNTADLSSYVDDIGKTRGSGFASVKVSKSSVIKNVKHYGYRGFISLESVNPNASHFEDSVVGYNCETNIYTRQSTFQRGYSRDIGINNTATQKTYWCGMSSGIGTNGKDALMSEADHVEDYVYDNIWAEYAIEKPLYVQSKKSIGFNIRAYNCLHAGQAKHNKGVQEGTLILRDNIAIDSTSLTGIGAINGFSKAELFNQTIENSVKNKGRGLIVYNVGDCTVDGLTVKNLGVPITIGGASDQNSGRLTIKNAVYDNCFSDTAAIFERFDASVAPNPKLTTLVLDNNSAIFPQGFTATSLPVVGADLKDVLNIEIKKSNWSARGVPFKTYSDLNSVKISDSVFDIYSVNNMYNSFSALSNSSYEFKANTFDCILNIKPTDAIVEFAKFHCLKNIDTGLTYVSNSWILASLNLAISAVGSTNILLLGAGRSLSISAESGGSKIHAIYDAATKSITSIYNVGSVFSTVKADNKVCINVDSSNRINIDVGNGLTWTQGAIKIKLNLD